MAFFDRIDKINHLIQTKKNLACLSSLVFLSLLFLSFLFVLTACEKPKGQYYPQNKPITIQNLTQNTSQNTTMNISDLPPTPPDFNQTADQTTNQSSEEEPVQNQTQENDGIDTNTDSDNNRDDLSLRINLSALEVSEEEPCLDTDEGLNFNSFGACKDLDNYQYGITDFCLSDTKLVEFRCKDNQCRTWEHTCSCENGVCIN